MKEKKDIDSLFQERFEGFQASPPPEAWDHIQAKLKREKDDRKIIPLWWRAAGIAALIALLFAVGNWIFTPSTAPSDTFVETETSADTPPDESPDNVTKDAVQVVSDDAEENENSLDIIREKTRKSVSTRNRNTTIASEETTVINEDTSDNTSKTPQKKTLQQPASEKIIPSNTNGGGTQTVIAAETPNSSENSKETYKNTSEEILKNTEKSNEIIEGPVKVSETGIASKESNQKVNDANDASEETMPSNKKSLLEEIEKQKETEEALANTKETPNRSWEVTPNVGPVYYSSLGEGSSIDPTFADNQQSGDVNVSYGIQVSYNLNDRWSIRSGVNNVNLGYSTQGVEIASGPVSSALRSIDYNSGGTVLTVLDQGTLSDNPPIPGSGLENITPKNTGGNAEIQQRLSYFEVPLELKYALLNKRFGINMIGGVSTLFLGNNEVRVQDGAFRSTLGEANNLNDVSFSTNVGFGLDYKFSKRLKFNIEPMFKYQLNPYTDSSVGFRPYYFGVYSGLSFKF
ncbi:outer membrane beta-barrel protein [Altibacter sp. HG106]|uniref:outer membrane beta-barrel protein n=1 Tax=Altibacter sp. HG106 TaxID=3023937 RepID=UPI002350C2E5|nr:outer membrane beta-barrel protein [Altibacter sp. HG106]MDC7995046.1 outer membrane beta-barrel protein [Altibacter sp. HG106]